MVNFWDCFQIFVQHLGSVKIYNRVGIMVIEEVCEKKQVSLTACQQEVRTWFQEQPTAHQEVRTPRKHSSEPVKAEKVISIWEKDNCDHLTCPWGGIKWQKTSADDDRLNTMMGEKVERKIGLRENCCCQIGLPLIPWCKTNDKVAKFVWQNTHSLSDERHRSWCHIALWKVTYHKISWDIFFDLTFILYPGKAN